MFDLSRSSSPADWFLHRQEPKVVGSRVRAGILSRSPVSRTPAAIARMWMIGGPQGMSCETAKQALGLRPGPQDLVVYSQHRDGKCPTPRLISCQPYKH